MTERTNKGYEYRLALFRKMLQERCDDIGAPLTVIVNALIRNKLIIREVYEWHGADELLMEIAFEDAKNPDTQSSAEGGGVND
jgi:hypothetical protein